MSNCSVLGDREVIVVGDGFPVTYETEIFNLEVFHKHACNCESL